MGLSMIDRWDLAQKAEVKHESHSETPSDTKWTERWLDNQFSLSIEHLYQKKILEIGCGTGMIHSFDFKCENIGIDPLLLQFNSKTENSSASLVNGVGETLPFSDNYFDILIYYNVLDHTKYPEKTLDECFRVMANEGDLFISVNVFNKGKFTRKVADYIDPPHPHHFTSQQVRMMLSQAGFDPVSEKTNDLDVNSIKSKIANRFFGLQQYNAHWQK
jgi:SAM-dependent methyltransferase